MNIRFKKLYILLILVVFSITTFAQDPFKAELYLDSSTASVGEPVRVTIQVNRSGSPIFDLPKLENARWVDRYRQTSSSTRIINGKRSVNTSVTIAIYPEKTGTVKIPSFTVKSNGEKAQTNPAVLKIVPPQERVSASSSDDQDSKNLPAATGKISLPKGRYIFYTGEEIPLFITLDIPVNLPVAQLSYPVISNLDNALFTDYAKVNPENKRFSQPSRETVIINGIRVNRFTFRTSFRILKPGSYMPEAKTSLGIRSARRQSSFFEDDFFDGFFNSGASIVNKTLSFKKLPQAIMVKALPAAPVGVANTNLIGSWLGSATLSSNSAKVGEPLELTVEYTGIGAVDLFTAPELKLNDFRIYPPEIKKSTGQIQVKYALIPLSTGEKTISIKTCAFDSEKGKYEVFNFNLPVAIAKGNVAIATNQAKVVTPSEKTPSSTNIEKTLPEEKRDELFYQKAKVGNFVLLPLVKNNLAATVFFVVLGILIVLVCEYIRFNKKRKLLNEDFNRSKDLKKLYKALEETLNNTTSSENNIRVAAVEYFNLVLRLPMGSTPEDIAQNIKDEDVKTFFTSLNTSSFAPSGLKEESFTMNKVLAKKILKVAKKLTLLLVTFCAISLYGNSSFNDNFDKGNLPEAINDYKKYISNEKISPNSLYNLGATYYRMNNLPLAKLCFERALLLKPTDYETLENLNLVNRKLLQSETGNVDSFATLLTYTRDRLRPDQYLFIISFMFFVLCLIFVLRTKLGLTGSLTALALPCFIILTSIACIISQVNSSYNPNRVLVIEKSLELKTLPATSSGRVIAQIPGGNTAKVIEYKDNWARIEVNGQDGWAKRSAIEPIFSGKIF